MITTQYIVVRCPWTTTRWAVLNTVNNNIVDAGFRTRKAAQEYIAREYNPVTAWWREIA